MVLEYFVKQTFKTYAQLVKAVNELHSFDDRVVEVTENKAKKEIIIQTSVFNCRCSIENGLQFITDWMGQKPIIIIDKRLTLTPYEYGWCVTSRFSEARETYHSTLSSAIAYMKEQLIRWDMCGKKKLTKVEANVKIAAEKYLDTLLTEYQL